MSGKGGGGGAGAGKGSNGLAGVPAASRKMVQSLKEIVSNFSEQEIYAVLKECNMDPNEAVSRLLSEGSLLSTVHTYMDIYILSHVEDVLVIVKFSFAG